MWLLFCFLAVAVAVAVLLPCFVHALWTKYDKVRPKYGKRGRPAEKVTVVFYFTKIPAWESDLQYLQNGSFDNRDQLPGCTTAWGGTTLSCRGF